MVAREVFAVFVVGCLSDFALSAPNAIDCVDKSPSCSTLRGKPSLCYNTVNLNLCCSTCRTFNTGVQGCEYGDKASWCQNPTDKYPYTCYQNEAVCCASCATYKNTSLPAVPVALDVSMKHSIETRVVVDKFAFDRWKATVSPFLSEAEKKSETEKVMGKYIKAVVQGVNGIFGGLTTKGISLDMRIASVEYVTEETVAKETSPGSGKGQTDKMLKGLKRWLDRRKLNYPAVDHTMFFTGLDICSKEGDSKVLGVSNLGRICTDRSLSVIEATFNGGIILTFAHEMGHSLSCAHDGEGNRCSQDSKFIMDSHTNHNETDNFRFSDCSADYIKNKILALYRAVGGNCLSAENTRMAALVKSDPLGKLYTPDKMCQLTAGPGSHVCRGQYGGDSYADYSTICRAMWCSEADDPNKCMSVVGADGFTCGQNKECSLGFCKASSVPNSLADSCPLGDTPDYATVFADMTCAQLVTSAYAGACYRGHVNRACCNQCQLFKTSTTGCEYGDKIHGCVASLHCPELAAQECCGTCAKPK